ncbi:MAG: CYTH domain-containing protein [Patescibacteria group bacterium]
MIEVEKKFSLTTGQIKRIEKTADFIKEVKNTDIYYDTSDYSLLRRDIWLRNRDGVFEVKIPPQAETKGINVYEEITDQSEILKRLEIKKLSEDFEENLKLNGFKVLLKLITQRRKFKIKEFNIDIDKVDYGYTLCEIEKMVENEDEIEKASQEIFELAKSLRLEIKKIRGKCLEYFYQFNKPVYQIIEDLRFRYE